MSNVLVIGAARSGIAVSKLLNSKASAPVSFDTVFTIFPEDNSL